MALHRLVNLEGKRWEITDKAIIAEHSCDSCGEYMTEFATAEIPAGWGQPAHEPTLVELCERCLKGRAPVIMDCAVKLARRG